MEQISYKLEHFEGPLDLLLHLVDKNKINIYDIPIVKLTSQYLEYVRNLEREDLNLVSEFLVMAATLLAIKAKMLLPKEVDGEGEEIDPRAELVERLLEYKKYKLMGEELADREDGAVKHLYKPATLPPQVAGYVPTVDLDSLLDGLTLARLQRIFEQVMKRRVDKIDPIRSKFGTIKREQVSLEQRIGTVILYARQRRRFGFRQLLERQADKLEIVVTFLAVLELIKMGKIRLSQKEIFGDMDIESLEPEREETLELEGTDDFEG